MLRDTTDDGMPLRKSDALSAERLWLGLGEADGIIRELLEELHALEHQLALGTEEIEAAGTRMGQSQRLVSELRSEAEEAARERDIAVASLADAERRLLTEIDRAATLDGQLTALKASTEALEAAFDAVVEERANHIGAIQAAEQEAMAWVAECESLLHLSEQQSADVSALQTDRGRLAAQLHDAQEQLRAAEAARVAAESEYNDLLTRATELENTVCTLRESVREGETGLDKGRHRIRELESAIDDTEAGVRERDARLESIQGRLAAVQALYNDLSLDRQASEEKIADYEARIAAFQERVAGSERRIGDLLASIAEKEAIAESLRSEVSAAHEARDSASAILLSTKSEVHMLRQRIADLESTSSQFQQVQAQLREMEAASEEKASLLAQARTEAESLAHSVEAEVAARNEIASMLARANESAHALQSRIAALESERSGVLEHRDSLQQQLNQTKAELAASLQEGATLKAALAEVQSRLDHLESDAKEKAALYDGAVAESKQLRFDLQASAREYYELQARLSAAQEQFDSELESARSRNAELGARFDEIIAQRDAMARETTKLQLRVIELEQVIETNARQIAENSARQAALTDALRNAEQSAHASEAKMAELIADLSQIIDERDRLIDETADLQRSVAVLQGMAHDSEARIGDLVTETELKAAQIATATAYADKLQDELRLEREANDALIAALAGAEQSVRSMQARAEAIAATNIDLSSERDHLRGQLEDTISEVENLRAAVLASERRTLELTSEASRKSQSIAEALARADQLENELSIERLSQDSVIAALRNSEQATRATEGRIVELVSERDFLNKERDEAIRKLNDLEQAAQSLRNSLRTSEDCLDDARNRIRDLELRDAENLKRIGDARNHEHTLRLELQAEREMQDALIRSLDAAEKSAHSTEERVKHLVADNNTLRRKVQQLEVSGAAAKDAARVAEQYSSHLSRKVADLETHITRSEAYVRDLLSQIDEKAEQISAGAAYARDLEREVSTRERERKLLRSELEAVRKASLSEKLVMREYVDSLKQQVAEIPALRQAERALVSQTEDLIAAVQSEAAQITTLIDVVQSSRFWKVKHLINRILAPFIRN